MLGDKRRLMLEDVDDQSDDEIGMLPAKRFCATTLGATSTEYTTFGPVPISHFNASLFSPDAMVMVLVPCMSVNQVSVVALPPCVSPTSCAVPLPSFEPIVERMSEPILCDAPTEENGQARRSSSSTKAKRSVVQLTSVEILSLKGVQLFSSAKPVFQSGVLLQDISETSEVKRRIMGLLLSSPTHWNGVGVVTLMKNEKKKGFIPSLFMPDLMNISQYVRPLGFCPGELVLPSNAVCYTSYNKGNNQVTYIVTDMLEYNDVINYYDAVSEKKKKQGRLSYGMTVLKKFSKMMEVQFCFMTLLALSFYLFRKWCRLNKAFSKLLDVSYIDPSFEQFKSLIIEDSRKYTDSGFSNEDFDKLLQRADVLFKKLVHYFFQLYPEK